jgi:hypothetical protein
MSGVFVKTKSRKEAEWLLTVIRKMKFEGSVTELKEKKIKKQASKKHYSFTDEQMALPGISPTAAEFEAWLTKPDKDKGTDAETVRGRLLNKLKKETAK